MTTKRSLEEHAAVATTEAARERLVVGLPVTQRRLELAGASTCVLEGGDGPPLILLHGPGESAVNWRWVLPELVSTHRVIAPDLPAHGSSQVPDEWVSADRVLTWLGELIERTCPSPPALVGHVLGGAIAARYAILHGDQLRTLVLVDTLGLGRFRPSPTFAVTFMGFLAHPTRGTYTRFMRQCAFDLDALREDMGEHWEPFVTYNLGLARSPGATAAGRLFRELGLPRIPSQELSNIAVPTVLIWGRHDRANRLALAEAASRRYGWPLHVIEAAADDPFRDQPQAFLAALRSALHTNEVDTG